MNGWLLVSQAGGAIEKPPVELAKEIGSVLLLVGLVVIMLLGLGASALVMMMGGRLRRRVRDGLPPRAPPPDPMWPLQVPPAARENTEELDDGELEDRGEGRE